MFKRELRTSLDQLPNGTYLIGPVVLIKEEYNYYINIKMSYMNIPTIKNPYDFMYNDYKAYKIIRKNGDINLNKCLDRIYNVKNNDTFNLVNMAPSIVYLLFPETKIKEFYRYAYFNPIQVLKAGFSMPNYTFDLKIVDKFVNNHVVLGTIDIPKKRSYLADYLIKKNITLFCISVFDDFLTSDYFDNKDIWKHLIVMSDITMIEKALIMKKSVDFIEFLLSKFYTFDNFMYFVEIKLETIIEKYSFYDRYFYRQSSITILKEIKDYNNNNKNNVTKEYLKKL